MFSGVISEGCLPGGFLFCGRHCFSEVSHPQEHRIATRDTVVPMNIEVPTKYLLSYDTIFVFEIRMSPQRKPDALQTSAQWQLKCFESR